jgi:hypothetical protein
VIPSLPSAALPAVPAGALPREVREAGDDARQTYRAALGFERMLLGELTKAMGAAGGTGPQAELIGDTLADAVTAGGGAGLALDLFRTMHVEDAR